MDARACCRGGCVRDEKKQGGCASADGGCRSVGAAGGRRAGARGAQAGTPPRARAPSCAVARPRSAPVSAGRDDKAFLLCTVPPFAPDSTDGREGTTESGHLSSPLSIATGSRLGAPSLLRPPSARGACGPTQTAPTSGVGAEEGKVGDERRGGEDADFAALQLIDHEAGPLSKALKD